ncbi:hypothetical protein PAEAM_30150 [Paenibacillus sp. GM1FR]|nr:hypothetical protein PAEAM_30150 [Paenibacillus sp. GM1FR]
MEPSYLSLFRNISLNIFQDPIRCFGLLCRGYKQDFKKSSLVFYKEQIFTLMSTYFKRSRLCLIIFNMKLLRSIREIGI